MDDHALTEYLNKSVPKLISLYRFGSQTKGTDRPDSDVDLAVLARDTIPAIRRFELAQDLASQLHREVDLIDLRSASTVMRMQVLSPGTRLNAPDEQARLNGERRDILKKIAESGSSMADDVILNKAASIERCIQRVLEEFAGTIRIWWRIRPSRTPSS